MFAARMTCSTGAGANRYDKPNTQCCMCGCVTDTGAFTVQAELIGNTGTVWRTRSAASQPQRLQHASLKATSNKQTCKAAELLALQCLRHAVHHLGSNLLSNVALHQLALQDNRTRAVCEFLLKGGFR